MLLNIRNFLGNVPQMKVSQTVGGQTYGYTKWFEYDPNGNLRFLLRTDEAGNTLLRLSYHYDHPVNGNALTSITLNGTPSGTFEYDQNGNMTVDGQSGVQIAYNLLNLPEKVSANGNEATYIYSADGTKLAAIAPNGSHTYYRSVFTYAQEPNHPEELLYALRPEGIVANTNTSWEYKYFKRDHVGSRRVLLAAHGNQLVTEQQTDYYPFGLSHGGLNNLHLNRYLYGGKEYQDVALGGTVLGLYDFHARYYNPLLGRWFNPDPANQTTNPYLYCWNSPMMYVDPDGRFIFGAISGFWKGVFSGKNPLKTAWQGGVNETKIQAGLFTSDKRKNFGEQAWEIASRFTWQLPQTVLGYTWSQSSNYAGQVDHVDYWGGATVTSGKNWGKRAVTLGSYIVGDRTIKADPNNSLFQHEYGHYLQSQEMGLGYLSRVAIPSLFSAAIKDNFHDFQPFEQDANRRAFMYFNENVGGFYKSEEDQYADRGWNFRNNPLDVYHTAFRGDYYDYHNPEHRALINRLALRANLADYAGWALIPFAPAGALVWLGSTSLINTLWYDGTRITR